MNSLFQVKKYSYYLRFQTEIFRLILKYASERSIKRIIDRKSLFKKTIKRFSIIMFKKYRRDIYSFSWLMKSMNFRQRKILLKVSELYSCGERKELSLQKHVTCSNPKSENRIEPRAWKICAFSNAHTRIMRTEKM